MDKATRDRIMAGVPFWTTRTVGWEKAEDAAALQLYGAYNRALAEGRYADSHAIRQEMRS